MGRRLVVLSGRTKGTSFVLTKSRVKAGRESDNGICLKGKRVAGHHAVLVRTNGEYTLRNLSPRVGTLLNGLPTEEAALKPGDRIRIGEVEMSYEATGMPSPGPASATAPPLLDELVVVHRQLAAAQQEADDARALAERTAAELTQARAEAERSSVEFQRRIAVLTQEFDRIAGGTQPSREPVETGPTKSSAESSPQPTGVVGRITAISRGTGPLADRGGELQAKISELEESQRQVRRLEAELAAAQVATQQLREELARARRPTRLDAIAEELGRALESDPSGRAGELGRLQAALTEARTEWDRISELHAQVEQLAVENHALRIAATDAQEEALLARRCLSDQTNEEFSRLRRSLVAKRNEELDRRGRFLRPFGVKVSAGRPS
ncbi:MAG TPA: FHA domain-containing protein [Verrucomicrobiae bacterium]|nr:FHA domain-containing protein [Verrucomicrobiae bacterium]